MSAERHAQLRFASANEANLPVGPVAEWLRRGTAAAAQADVAALTTSPVGTGYLHRPHALKRAVRLRGDHKRAGTNRTVRLGGSGQHSGVDEAETRVRAVAIGLIR